MDGGALDLHDDGLAGGQTGAVDLTEGGGGQRRRVEPVENLFQGRAELSLHDLAQRLHGLRGDFVLQAGQLGGDVFGEHVDARRHELAHFDPHAAQLDGQGAVALRGAVVAARRAAARHRPQADAAQYNIPQDDVQQDRGEKAQHAPMAGAQAGIKGPCDLCAVHARGGAFRARQGRPWHRVPGAKG